MSETLVVYGGSFDPPHLGHTLAVAYVLCAYRVDRVLVLPACAHPFGKRLSPFEQRLRMCELAFASLRRVEICALERELPLPNLTVRTLEALHARHPAAELRLLIGSDLLAETHAWHDFARVTQLAKPLVVQRQGHERPEASGPALPDLSSTEARHRLRAGLSTEGLLTPDVALYAREHALYE